jgi:hypothetical protein
VHDLGFESDFLVVNGSVVNGRGFESLSFEGQWWCTAWSLVRIRIFDYWWSMVV